MSRTDDYYRALMREGLHEDAEAYALAELQALKDWVAYDEREYERRRAITDPRSADLTIEGGSTRSRQVEAEHENAVRRGLEGP